MKFIEKKIIEESEMIKSEYSEEIAKIINIEDDDNYKWEVHWFISRASEDKEGFPIEIPPLEVFTSLLKRNADDVDIIKAEYKNIETNYNSWESNFRHIDTWIFEDIIKQLEKGNVKFRDFNISFFYDPCGAYSFREKENVKEALFRLTVKYPYFEAKGETKYRLHNPKLYERAKNLERAITNPLTKYKVYGNPLFCLEDDYFSKQDKLIIDFLTETEKVAISHEMILIPFNYKKNYYYLTIDNLGKTMILNTVNTGFMYINRQSNLYYQIYANVSEELRNDFYEFEHHFIENMRKAMGINSQILKKIYKKPDRLIRSKYVDFKENES